MKHGVDSADSHQSQKWVASLNCSRLHAPRTPTAENLAPRIRSRTKYCPPHRCNLVKKPQNETIVHIRSRSYKTSQARRLIPSTMVKLSCRPTASACVGAILVSVPLVFLSLDASSLWTAREMMTASVEKNAGNVSFSVKNMVTKSAEAKKTIQTIQIQQQPKVAWLMSFPNSGTSYTITNTETLSQRSAATNYATEISIDHGDLVPLPKSNGDEARKGPWQSNPKLPLPSKRVLCKTHCKGYWDYDSVAGSVQTIDSFLDGCRESLQRRNTSTPSSNRNKLRLYYNTQGLVDSAIHLIRDPFDNIISRIHHGMRHRHKEEYANMTSADLETFLKSKKAVTSWCKTIDEHFWKKQQVTAGWNINNETLSMLPYDPTPYLDIPCHGEFFRHAQWHNTIWQWR